MLLVRCSNNACARPFQANRFGSSVVPELEHGKITCPHCGNVETADPNIYYLGHPLTPQQETQFNTDYPLAAGQHYVLPLFSFADS
jgi:hypothetical protein